jgi:hypothetical protein
MNGNSEIDGCSKKEGRDNMARVPRRRWQISSTLVEAKA